MKVKLWRRAFAASMSAVMLLGLTACGGSNSTESSDFAFLKNNDKPNKSAGMLPSKILQGWGTACLFCIIVSLFSAISSSVEFAKL